MLTKLQDIYLLVFFISCFTVSIITPKSSNHFMILIVSFTSSFKINKVNPFPAPTAPSPLIFLSNVFIAFDFKLLTNPGKLSLAKEIATFASEFFPKLASQEPKYPPDLIIYIFELY